MSYATDHDLWPMEESEQKDKMPLGINGLFKYHLKPLHAAFILVDITIWGKLHSEAIREPVWHVKRMFLQTIIM